MNQEQCDKAIKTHLINYKENVLGIRKEGKGYGAYQKFTYRHILPREYEKDNILSPYREEIIEAYWSKIDHSPGNLKSSQVVCINFFSLLDQLPNEICTRFLSKYINCDEFINHDFEVDCTDSGGFKKPTQVDYQVISKFNDLMTKNLFEIKYSEKTFKKNYSYEDLIKYESKFYGVECSYKGKTYNSPELDNHVQYEKINSLLKKAITFDEFMEHYQLYRNLYNTPICLEGTFTVIVTKHNDSIRNQFDVFYKRFTNRLKDNNKHLQNRIQLLFWEDLVDDLEMILKDTKSNKQLKHLSEFREKYLFA